MSYTATQNKHAPTPPLPALPQLQSAKAREANLDVLRCAGLILVVWHHFWIQEHTPWHGAWYMAPAMAWWSGCDLLFVLSGFLVGGRYWQELSRTGSVKAGRFWMWRWVRIVPPYLVGLHIAFLSKKIFVDRAMPYDPGYLAYLQNYTGMPFFDISWCLCIAEQFYLVLPLALRLATKAGRRIHYVFAALCVLPLILRLALIPEGAEFGYYYFAAAHFHFEALLAGVWMAYTARFHPNIWRTLGEAAQWPAVAAVLFVLSFAFLRTTTDFQNRYLFALYALSFAAILAAVSARPVLPLGRSAFVKVLASCTYSIYLIHLVVLHAYLAVVARRLPEIPAWVHLAVVLSVIFLTSWVFSAVVEKPMIGLRDKLFSRHASPGDETMSTASVPQAG